MLKAPGPNSVMPKPCLNGVSWTARQRSITLTGSGAPPLVTKRRLDRSARAKRSEASSSWYWVGTGLSF
jgi:hypothetical protein